MRWSSKPVESMCFPQMSKNASSGASTPLSANSKWIFPVESWVWSGRIEQPRSLSPTSSGTSMISFSTEMRTVAW